MLRKYFILAIALISFSANADTVSNLYRLQKGSGTTSYIASFNANKSTNAFECIAVANAMNASEGAHIEYFCSHEYLQNAPKVVNWSDL